MFDPSMFTYEDGTTISNDDRKEFWIRENNKINSIL